jgi:hypothetical protein
MADTLLLDRGLWDLVTDTAGNIAVAAKPYALAQDAASAIKLFSGELWYDTTKGVPYWSEILGHGPPASLVKSKLTIAARTVPEVIAAKCYISSFTNRVVSGQVHVTDAAGVAATAGF